MQSYLAIDIGASGGRHIIGWMDEGHIRTREVYRFENGMQKKNGHLIWDAEFLFEQVISGMKACHEQGFNPVSVGIDTWGVDFALLNHRGEIVGDLVAYRDARTEGMDVILEKKIAFEDMYRITGIAKQPYNTVYQMMAALREHPEYRNEVVDFLLVPEYLSYRLCGRKAHEWTELSTTALIDIHQRDWSTTVCEAAGLPEAWFRTPIVQPGTELGHLLPDIASAVGFDAKVILPASHDTGSAYMAVPARDERAVFLSSGTWSLLGVELSTPVVKNESRESGFTNEGGWGGTTRHLRNIMGMWMLQSIRRDMGRTHSYAEMAEMAEKSTYPAWVDVTDQRFMSPVNMVDEVKAALRDQGAPVPQSIDDILRAVTVGLATCYRDSILSMSEQIGQTFTSINIVGGGCQNRTLNRLTAMLTGLSVYAGPTEGTALGNLGAQMIADHQIADLAEFRDIIMKDIAIETFQP